MAGDAAPVYRSLRKSERSFYLTFRSRVALPKKDANGVLRRFFISQETYGADNLQDFYLMEENMKKPFWEGKEYSFFQP